MVVRSSRRKEIEANGGGEAPVPQRARVEVPANRVEVSKPPPSRPKKKTRVVVSAAAS